jgi:hypothetical protein
VAILNIKRDEAEICLRKIYHISRSSTINHGSFQGSTTRAFLDIKGGGIKLCEEEYYLLGFTVA